MAKDKVKGLTKYKVKDWNYDFSSFNSAELKYDDIKTYLSDATTTYTPYTVAGNWTTSQTNSSINWQYPNPPATVSATVAIPRWVTWALIPASVMVFSNPNQVLHWDIWEETFALFGDADGNVEFMWF